MTFRQFLKTIQEECSPDGDFAYDFLRDHRMKGKCFISLKLLLDALPHSACNEAKVAAKSCFKRYVFIKRNLDGL